MIRKDADNRDIIVAYDDPFDPYKEVSPIMDDPFGPSIISLVLLILAAVVRIADAAIPFLDEGEINRRADEGDAKALRALRLIKRSERAEFGEFRMAHALLLICAGVAACAAFGPALAARFAAAGISFGALLAAVCVLIPFALIAFVPFSVLVMRQPVSWNYAAASVCIFLAVFFIFCK